MTREEAIEGLKAFRREFSGYEPNEEMFDLAIKALEQEPTTKNDCENCIHNKGVLECDMYGCKYEQTTKNDLALLEKTYADFCNCEGGEGWLKIDGKEYATDAGYALEGMSIFMEVFKRRLAELPSVTPQERKGHWIGHREHCENLGVMPSGLGAYEWCSNCDCGIDVEEWQSNDYNYCPNCGAKMVEP